MTVDELPEFSSPQQLADLMGVPLETARKWQQNGQAPAAHRVGRHLRYAKADIKRWLASRRETPQVATATPINATARRAATRRAG